MLAERGRPPPRPAPALREPDFAANKISEAVLDRVQLHLGGRPEVVARDPDIRLVAIFGGDVCTLLLDLAGAPLSRRDRRPEGRCLRPTLAATVAASSGWRGHRPLRLPADQSGILAIETLQRALRIAPNSRREFGVERWPNDGERLGELLDAERKRALAHEDQALAGAQLDVQISDHDRGIVRTISKNIAAAGMADLVRVERINSRRLPVPERGTLLLANPPEGDRIGQEAAARLYADLGAHWRTFEGCDAWVFNGSGDFVDCFGQRPAGGRRLFNGKDMVDLLYYRFERVDTW
jgi:putative N6-adenine-specific DNA methylase